MKLANDAVRFALELAAIAAYAALGFHVGSGALRWLLAVAAIAIGAAIWGRWMAPRSPHQLDDPSRFAAELCFFGVAFGGLAVTGRTTLGVALLALAVVNTPLDRVLAGR